MAGDVENSIFHQRDTKRINFLFVIFIRISFVYLDLFHIYIYTAQLCIKSSARTNDFTIYILYSLEKVGRKLSRATEVKQQSNCGVNYRTNVSRAVIREEKGVKLTSCLGAQVLQKKEKKNTNVRA